VAHGQPTLHNRVSGSVEQVGTDHVRWLAEPSLTRPVMIAAFTGWNDAGDAASAALRTMIESWGADALAEIDPDVFTDFATVRPQVRLDEEHHRSIVWPTVGVWSASLPGTDVILVLGPEPALRWRLFTDQLVGIAETFDVSMAISLGALLADVPHSRPVPLIGTATDDTMIERFELQRSQYEGPTGIVGVLQDALHRQGLPTASLWAAVPGYASQIPSPKAAMALVDRSCSMIGTPAPLSRLAAAATEYEVRVASLIGDDDDMVEYLHRLEQLADDDSPGFTDLAMSDDDDFEGDDAIDADSLDPDVLVEEVEQFLRDRTDD
jgi:proteasome assembly chaperone (PAC2) family protein